MDEEISSTLTLLAEFGDDPSNEKVMEAYNKLLGIISDAKWKGWVLIYCLEHRLITADRCCLNQTFANLLEILRSSLKIGDDDSLMLILPMYIGLAGASTIRHNKRRSSQSPQRSQSVKKAKLLVQPKLITKAKSTMKAKPITRAKSTMRAKSTTQLDIRNLLPSKPAQSDPVLGALRPEPQLTLSWQRWIKAFRAREKGRETTMISKSES